jgi:hypothetical protein
MTNTRGTVRASVAKDQRVPRPIWSPLKDKMAQHFDMPCFLPSACGDDTTEGPSRPGRTQGKWPHWPLAGRERERQEWGASQPVKKIGAGWTQSSTATRNSLQGRKKERSIEAPLQDNQAALSRERRKVQGCVGSMQRRKHRAS